MSWNDNSNNQSQDAGFMSFDKVTIDHLINFSIYKVLSLSTENVERYSIAVDNIENLISDQLDQDYYDKLKAKKDELDATYKKKRQEEYIRELATFKFKLLMVKVKKKIPKKEMLVL